MKNAYYTSIPTYQENKIDTKKYIVINKWFWCRTKRFI